ncbi:thioredoxin domain-containing protein [Candidatus Bathyarchaeota archaeon]|nr:MAG: thioredoxin domain-containing protein [Candidatus Bathyarchaeota archaeon]
MSPPNRLIDEKSPYLLQHAYNPVDWYPWGEEAFLRAEVEDKPVFLSIGYSTCHWCHVMEHECFTDSRVAELMNEAFINIKVDREDRPDIDGVYMAVSQMLTGGGGWPLTIIMTPDKRPFYAATYIPKESGYGRIGMLDLVPQIKNYWMNQRERLESISENVAHNLGHINGGDEEIPVTVFDTAFTLLEDLYDDKFGGFGPAPKFPSPHNLLYLLRYWRRTGNEKALDMVEKTLTEMKRGGIFDHIGYGFHRYSTDQMWLVPHFEKMLYDQAMLLMAYTEAFLATGKQGYRKTGEEIIAYVLRDLASPDGGFYSAEDADSEGEEGKFYVWDVEELEKILTEEEFEQVIKHYNVRPEGNYLEEATQQKTGKNILHMKKEQSENSVLVGAKNKLFETREMRPRPLLDDKVLTDWNGLMIVALCKAGRAFHVKEYIEEAVRSAEFIIGKMWDGGILLHRYREDEAEIAGFLNDCAFMTWALIELYQATYEKRYLDTARELNDMMLLKFSDANGGLFFTSEDSEILLTRRKEIYDGAIPSGNSVAFYNMLRLSRLTGENKLEDEAKKLSRYFSSSVLGAPHAYSMFLSGLDFAFGPSTEVVLTGEAEKLAEIIEVFSGKYLPNTVTHVWSSELAESIPYLAELKQTKTPMIYVCKDFVCNLPTNNIEKALKRIEEK